MKQLVQGDLLLVEVSGETVEVFRNHDGSGRIQPQDGKIVILIGEKTGHAHTVDAETAELYLPCGNTNFYGSRLVVVADTQIVHERLDGKPSGELHESMDVPAGIYTVKTQRVYMPKVESRRVRD